MVRFHPQNLTRRFAPPFAIFQEQDFDVIELLLKSEVASPGCGCNQALVQELGAELQERKVRRGNIAQIKMKAM